MTPRTAAWQTLANDNARLAVNGRRLLYQSGVDRLGYASQLAQLRQVVCVRKPQA